MSVSQGFMAGGRGSLSHAQSPETRVETEQIHTVIIVVGILYMLLIGFVGCVHDEAMLWLRSGQPSI